MQLWFFEAYIKDIFLSTLLDDTMRLLCLSGGTKIYKKICIYAILYTNICLYIERFVQLIIESITQTYFVAYNILLVLVIKIQFVQYTGGLTLLPQLYGKSTFVRSTS